MQARPTLSAEQVEAVRYLCERSGAVATVEGLPDTGKSVLLDAAREAWETAGHTVVGAALSGQAALGLQASAGIPSATLHARLNEWAPAIAAPAAAPATAAAPVVNDGMRFANGGRPAVGSLDARTVVVVDEAGMVDSRTLAALIDATQAAGAKLVLVGDHRQLQPVEAGGMFRVLTERIETANLTEIRRQAEPWAREAVHAVAEGRAGAALAAYEERGLLHVGDGKAETVEALVSAWAEAGRDSPAASRLMLAGERADVRALNHQARDHLQQTGHLGQGQKIDTAHGPREFAVGDRVVCTRNSTPYGVKNGQLGTVEGIESRRDGTTLRVRLDEGGRVATLPTARYPHLDHGYALTTHKAQGATVDRAFVLAGGNLANRELGPGATEPAPPGRPGVRGSELLRGPAARTWSRPDGAAGAGLAGPGGAIRADRRAGRAGTGGAARSRRHRARDANGAGPATRNQPAEGHHAGLPARPATEPRAGVGVGAAAAPGRGREASATTFEFSRR